MNIGNTTQIALIEIFSQVTKKLCVKALRNRMTFNYIISHRKEERKVFSLISFNANQMEHEKAEVK